MEPQPRFFDLFSFDQIAGYYREMIDPEIPDGKVEKVYKRSLASMTELLNFVRRPEANKQQYGDRLAMLGYFGIVYSEDYFADFIELQDRQGLNIDPNRTFEENFLLFAVQETLDEEYIPYLQSCFSIIDDFLDLALESDKDIDSILIEMSSKQYFKIEENLRERYIRLFETLGLLIGGIVQQVAAKKIVGIEEVQGTHSVFMHIAKTGEDPRVFSVKLMREIEELRLTGEDFSEPKVIRGISWLVNEHTQSRILEMTTNGASDFGLKVVKFEHNIDLNPQNRKRFGKRHDALILKAGITGIYQGIENIKKFLDEGKAQPVGEMMIPSFLFFKNHIS